MLELPTGFGKTALSIHLVNHLCNTVYKGKKIKMLLLVAKTVHKQTWKDEFEKWGGINADEVVIECYESLRKHADEVFDILVADEVHHIGSEVRMELLTRVHFKYSIGLSATIPRAVKAFFRYRYHSLTVKCDIAEAIEDEVLPEPEILLLPLKLDNTIVSEEWEINPKAEGKVIYGEYKDIWKYKNLHNHVILSCTQKQKSNEFNSDCLKLKKRFHQTRNEGIKNLWLQRCGQRLEFYSNCKIPVVKQILEHLKNYRTITFCKTIEQCEQVGRWCIHSRNGKLSTQLYNDFNQKKIKHITAVNILNENANLVDCKYGVFCNLAASGIVQVQRVGRLLRHRQPVLVIPFYEGTREEEIIGKWFEDYNKDYIRTIHSIEEI